MATKQIKRRLYDGIDGTDAGVIMLARTERPRKPWIVTTCLSDGRTFQQAYHTFPRAVRSYRVNFMSRHGRAA